MPEIPPEYYLRKLDIANRKKREHRKELGQDITWDEKAEVFVQYFRSLSNELRIEFMRVLNLPNVRKCIEYLREKDGLGKKTAEMLELCLSLREWSKEVAG